MPFDPPKTDLDGVTLKVSGWFKARANLGILASTGAMTIDYAAGIMEVNSIWQDDSVPLQLLAADKYDVLFTLIVFQVDIPTCIFLPLLYN